VKVKASILRNLPLLSGNDIRNPRDSEFL